MQGRVFYYGSMPRLNMIPTLLRESWGTRSLARQPEPALIMDDADQVAAYAAAGRIDGVMAAAYLFHTARISQVIQGCKRVVDLGCGPATQLAQVAEHNPGIQFVGVDLSEEMLTQARAHVAALGLGNVEFRQGDVTRLDGMADHSADGVISTMALHHLPTLDHLRACFRQINRILKQDGALYIVDFGRLKSLKSVQHFAGLNAAHQPPLFTLDYENSMRAAFLAGEFAALTAELLPPQVRLYKTFIIPMLVILKTADHPLPDDLRKTFQAMRGALPSAYRRDLDEIRLFLRLGGLSEDPFAE